MDQDLVVLENENGSISEEEIIQDPETTSINAEIIQVLPEEINISDPFFMGVQICGIMCLFSLGVAVIISIFRKA